MKKFAVAIAAVAVALVPVAAQAGGFGKSGNNSLVNVSPSIKVDDIKVLNGSPILSGNSTASGNTVLSGILNGNKTSVGEGLLGNGILTGGILSGNSSYKLGKH